MTDDPRIERAAKAIYASGAGPASCGPWEGLSDGMKAISIRQARAAILSFLSEPPSEAMHAAGQGALLDYLETEAGFGDGSGVWRAMTNVAKREIEND